jgi:hypothetical protein
MASPVPQFGSLFSVLSSLVDLQLLVLVCSIVFIAEVPTYVGIEVQG